MLLTLELPTDVADQLTAEANRQGLSLDQYVLQAAVNQVRHVGTASFDPYLGVGGERARAAAEEAERLGVTDSLGRRLRGDLPDDMREGTKRDFGG